jgi:hypothetical protein
MSFKALEFVAIVLTALALVPSGPISSSYRTRSAFHKNSILSYSRYIEDGITLAWSF